MTDALFPGSAQNRLEKHPFIALALLCFAASLVTDGSSASGFSGEAPVVFALCCAVAVCVYLCRSHDSWQRTGVVLSCGALAVLLLDAVTMLTHGAVWALLLTVLLLLGAAAAGLWFTRNLHTREALLLLLAAGFCLRLAYIIYTPVSVRQHDMGSFGGPNGHAAYIEYFYQNGSIFLPFDPRTRWQFYHPPLHHIIASLWLRLQVQCGLSYVRACEGIQILTLFYSSAVMLVFLRLFNRLHFRRLALLLPMSIICFHPTGIILSGSINNDALAVLLQFAALETAVQWYDTPTRRNILKVAFCVGGSMAAKLSGVLCAPAIAVLFLWKWWKNRRQTMQYVSQFAVFALICVPLGLGWSVLGRVKWDIPLGYVPVLGVENNSQYIGDYPTWRRLFDVLPDGHGNVFMAWSQRSGADYHEFNMFVGLIKTALFGEFTLFDPTGSSGFLQSCGLFFCRVLFILQLPLLALSLAGGVQSLRRGRELRHDEMLSACVFVLFAVTMLMYISTCLKAPHTCTQNFRYTTPLLLCGTVWLGNLVQHTKTGRHRLFAAILTGAFCCSSAMVYTLLGA